MIRAVRAVPGNPKRLEIAEVEERPPFSNEALVRVTAFSLNRGEVRRAERADTPIRIGWDIAGVVERAAADGSSPPEGVRVVGFSPRMEGWAERAPILGSYLSPIPDGVSDAAAATLPVAGLTALHSVDAGDCLIGARVLVTGATGGVGVFAAQLARIGGADVLSQIRRDDQRAFADRVGLGQLIVSPDGSGIEAAGPFRLVVDGVGGPILEAGVRALGREGLVVCYGVTAAPTISVAIMDFMTRGLARILGFHLYYKSEIIPPRDHLARLLGLVEQGRLDTAIEREASWEEVARTADDLIERRFPGKAVLHIA